ncbi:glycoside hydrolase family 43 protein [Paenibacillus wulumuqiensis]|uniref:glycoside hydrolase family 43 protein n=1 Tax=Paenibacillus wulumuqiensis TaxID=1567107 RepID=UPI000A408C2B|nr:glycoside hydrolase family 43 protein [Paenibacillus wulumuqiensis]
MKAADTAVTPTSRQMITNPILRGFNPDPCILRVEDTYYIVVSSFEWLPGVRVYESVDLVNWTYCTDILTDQVDLRGNPKNCSIWAPQLSYRDDRFYLLYTDVKSTKRPFKDDHNYLITAPDIHGPWSEPVYLNSSGFDPSLFHDDDGRKWLLNALWDYRITEGNKSSGIVIQEYDSTKGTLIGDPVKLFDCTPLKKTEAPHIYKRNGYYYLITAEGGTGTGHAVTVARSRELLGPYEVDPHNPMMTSSGHPEWPLQCAGHGSLVETHDGEWYMAHLCTRPLEGQYAILGRETALQQVYWDEEGWLRLTGGGSLPQLQVAAPVGYNRDASTGKDGLDKLAVGSTLHNEQLAAEEISSGRAASAYTGWTFEDSFHGERLRPEWNTLRILADESWCSLTARPGYLRLTAGESVQTLFHHHLLALRQQDRHFRAETALDYEPELYLQMAGLLLYLNEDNYLYAYVSREDSRKVIRLMKCAADQFSLIPECIVIPEQGMIHLAVEVHETTAQFYYAAGAAEDRPDWQPLHGPENISFLSGGFTGNFIGIAAHDMYQFRGSHADFSYFRYQGQDR